MTPMRPPSKYLTHDGRYFVWLGDYDTRHIPKAARFTWTSIVPKKWATADVDKAAELAKYADDEAQAKLAGRVSSTELSRATDAKLDVPAPEGRAYLPYQRAGIAYAMGRPSTLIADEMGLGKTIEAIGTINADPSIHVVLVICPASLKLNWQRE